MDRIAVLQAKRVQLAAKQKQLEAKARNENRKNETRRKIVVGAAVLNAMEKDTLLARQVMRILNAAVGRAQDRAVIADLLGSPPPPAANGQTAPEASQASASAS